MQYCVSSVFQGYQFVRFRTRGEGVILRGRKMVRLGSFTAQTHHFSVLLNWIEIRSWPLPDPDPPEDHHQHTDAETHDN